MSEKECLRDEVWNWQREIEQLEEKGKFSRVKKLKQKTRRNQRKIRKLNSKTRGKCSICKKVVYPLYDKVCQECYVKLDIFEKIGDCFFSYRKYLVLAVEKPERCCVCGKMPYFSQNKVCYICHKKVCYSHKKEITLYAESSGKHLFGVFADVCDSCMKKAEGFIIVKFFKSFEKLLKENLEIQKRNRKIKRKKIK